MKKHVYFADCYVLQITSLKIRRSVYDEKEMEHHDFNNRCLSVNGVDCRLQER